ncbi:MAG: AMP-binding protein [Acidobacteriota bacterium]|nr:AMP-binding protein [Acidobacteriota bacterium]
MSSNKLLERFQSVVCQFPERPAVYGPGQVITYSDLERRAASVARRIAGRTAGNTVALLYGNRPEFAALLLGAMWAGKTVAVLPTLAPPPLLKLMCMETGVDLVITSEEFVPGMMAAGIQCWIGDASADVDPSAVPQVERKCEAAVLLYTSGTTGRPKAVALSEANIIGNIEGLIGATGFDSEQVMLAVLPFFHAYGLTVMILLPLTTGAAVVVPERFIPRQILQLIEKHKVSCLIAVPSQFRVLIKEPTEIDACSLWLCIAGAERLPDHVAQDFQKRFGHPLAQGYGTTELSPVVSFSPPEDSAPGSVGRPLPNIAVTIRDENDNILPAGEVGEVCVSGPSVMLGYLGDQEGTARKIRDGVLHTSDKGYLSADGYLFLMGRADDLVKVSGEKMYPSEVENALETIDGVEEAAVVAFPDEKHGSRLHAYVQLLPGAELTDAALRAACREMMEHYKIPRGFTFVPQMPRTVTGKTDKRALVSTAAQ